MLALVGRPSAREGYAAEPPGGPAAEEQLLHDQPDERASDPLDSIDEPRIRLLLD